VKFLLQANDLTGNQLLSKEKLENVALFMKERILSDEGISPKSIAEIKKKSGKNITSFKDFFNLLNSPFFCAKYGDELLRETINSQDCNGKTPLMCLISMNLNSRFENFQKYFYEILTCENLNVSLIDEHKESALHCAARFGDEKMCQALLEKRRKCRVKFINGQNIHGETPLIAALRRDKIKSVKILLEYGADAALESKYGAALQIAQENCDYEVIETLRKALNWRQIISFAKIRSYTNGKKINPAKVYLKIKM
jgi:ankyrin repeat protein